MNRFFFCFVLSLISVPAIGRVASTAAPGMSLPASATASSGPSGCLTDTTQTDFAAGVPTNVDLDSSPGDAILLASSALDQQNTTVGTVGDGFSSTAWFGQTFTPSVSGTLAEVDLDLFCAGCSGTTPDITVSIRNTLSGGPSGNDLATATIPGFSSGTAAFFPAVFSPALHLTAGTIYAVVVRANADPSAGTYSYKEGFTNPYPGGHSEVSTDSGTTWFGQTRDIGFKTFMRTTFPASGDLISSSKDGNPTMGSAPSWTTLRWQATTPTSTSVRFQVAGSNSSGGPFSFVGPDGTAATYFTTSGSSLLQFSGNRYLEYRAYLATTDSAVTPTLKSATVCYVQGLPADIAVSNDDGVASAIPGASITYTITASNSGPGDATGIAVADSFPATLSCSWTCGNSGGGTCTASGSGDISDTIDLPNGTHVTYSATCTIPPGAAGSLSNTATVAFDGDANLSNNSATDVDTLTPQGDISITNTDSVATATPGTSVVYVITASNGGPSDATGITVADSFPASLSCTWTCNNSGGGTCAASGSGAINDSIALPKATSVAYSATCAIAKDSVGTLSNTATVTSAHDGNPANNSATDNDTLTPQADLSITNSDGVTMATAGTSVSYTITAANAGPSDAPASTVTDTFPGSLSCTWTCGGAAGGSCTASGSGDIHDTGANLPKGGSAVYTANCAISAAATGSLSNTASAAPPGGVTDPNSGNNSQTDTDTLNVQADLVVTLTDNRNFVQIGDMLDYRIDVTNPTGPSKAVANVSDVLPAQLSGGLWTCTPSGGASCAAGAGNTLTDTATLPVGGKASYQFSAVVQDEGVDGTIVDMASADLTSGTDPTPANNSATDTDIIVIFNDGFEGP